MSLEGKTAVIVGASGKHNFGVSTARLLAKNGANVVISGRRQHLLDALAEEIGGIGISCDMNDESSIEALFAGAKAHTGRVDIAINSAGGLAGGRNPRRGHHHRRFAGSARLPRVRTGRNSLLHG